MKKLIIVTLITTCAALCAGRVKIFSHFSLQALA